LKFICQPGSLFNFKLFASICSAANPVMKLEVDLPRRSKWEVQIQEEAKMGGSNPSGSKNGSFKSKWKQGHKGKANQQGAPANIFMCVFRSTHTYMYIYMCIFRCTLLHTNICTFMNVCKSFPPISAVSQNFHDLLTLTPFYTFPGLPFIYFLCFFFRGL
jgi:hypothetical protein